MRFHAPQDEAPRGMKIVISWSRNRVLANAEKAIWCGKPDYEIGVALFYEPHSARKDRG
jgi:hypothetical protein